MFASEMAVSSSVEHIRQADMREYRSFIASCVLNDQQPGFVKAGASHTESAHLSPQNSPFASEQEGAMDHDRQAGDSALTL